MIKPKENWEEEFDKYFDCGNLEDGRRACSFAESKVKSFIRSHFISRERVEEMIEKKIIKLDIGDAVTYGRSKKGKGFIWEGTGRVISILKDVVRIRLDGSRKLALYPISEIEALEIPVERARYNQALSDLRRELLGDKQEKK